MESIIENNKLIAEFMGIKWKPVRGDYNRNSSSFKEILFDTQAECLKFCEGFNVGKNPDYAFFPLPDVLGYELKYHSSWDWLMPVVEKIEQECKGQFWVGKYATSATSERIGNFEIPSGARLPKIEAVYSCVVKFIKWHNQLTNQHS